MKKIAAAVLLLSCGVANATLVASGDQVIDTDTGHHWFKVSETIGLSYNQMLAQFSTPGSRFFGYQYATPGEFATLMYDGGYPSAIPFTGYNYSGGNQASAASIMDLFGSTADYNLPYFVQTRIDGWLDVSAMGSPIGLGFVTKERSPYSQAQYLTDLSGFLAAGSERNATIMYSGLGPRNIGSWIYQSETVGTVPEPSSLALLGLGLAGFVSSRRRSRK